jgi:hypothetical protein
MKQTVVGIYIHYMSPNGPKTAHSGSFLQHTRRRRRFRPVPPHNPFDRTIVDVSALEVELPYPMLHLLYALLATAGSRLT